MYRVEFRVPNDESLNKLLSCEIKEFTWDRHKATFKREDNYIIIRSESSDVKAMKAGLNSITDALDVHEKVKKIK